MHCLARPALFLGRHMTEQLERSLCLAVNASVFEMLFADVCYLLCYYININYLLSFESYCRFYDDHTICKKNTKNTFSSFLACS